MRRRISKLLLFALPVAVIPALANAAPSAGEIPEVTEVVARPDGVTVDWTVSDAIAAEAVLYEVTATVESEDEEVDGTVAGYAVVAADVRSASVTGLDPETDYAVQVTPVTPAGKAEASTPFPAALDVEGPEATAPGAPAEVAADAGAGTAGVDAGTVQVTWAPAADNGSPIIAYSLAAFDDDGIVAFRSVGADARSAVVAGLTDGEAVEVWVFAWNALGMGEVATVDVEPGSGDERVGGPVVPWAAAWGSETATVVTWGGATEVQEPVTGYDVILVIDGQFAGWRQTGPDARQLVVRPIPEGSTAQVYVLAHGATTLSALGDPITVAAPVDVVIETPVEEPTTTTTEPEPTTTTTEPPAEDPPGETPPPAI